MRWHRRKPHRPKAPAPSLQASGIERVGHRPGCWNPLALVKTHQTQSCNFLFLALLQMVCKTMGLLEKSNPPTAT